MESSGAGCEVKGIWAGGQIYGGTSCGVRQNGKLTVDGRDEERI